MLSRMDAFGYPAGFFVAIDGAYVRPVSGLITSGNLGACVGGGWSGFAQVQWLVSAGRRIRAR